MPNPGGEVRPSDFVDPPITYPPDNFWAFMDTTPGSDPTTQSLDEAIKVSGIVVVGRATDVVEAPGYGAPGEPILWYAEAVIEVTDVLKGMPARDDMGSMRIAFAIAFSDQFPKKQLDDLRRSIPDEPAVLMLTSWATYFEESGGDTPSWLDGLNRDDLYRTIGAEGALRITSKGIDPAPQVDGWPQEWRDVAFEDFKAQVSN